MDNGPLGSQRGGNEYKLPSERAFNPAETLKPLEAGEAAALGLRLTSSPSVEWVRVDTTGKAELVQVNRQDLAQRLWIPSRDLRQLDPTLPIIYPSSIFIRERAIIVNAENVRMIIAKDEVYVTSVPTPGSADQWQHPSPTGAFTRDLCWRLAPDPLSAPTTSPIQAQTTKMDRSHPFELRAVEAALAAAIRVLEIAVGDLERFAFPALEALVHRVGRSELDKVRAAKSMTSHLLSRVGRLRKELQEILSDDQDMADMYLGKREELEEWEPFASSTSDPSTPDRASHGSEDHRQPELDLSDGAAPIERDGPLDRVPVAVYDPSGTGGAAKVHNAGGPRELRTAHPHDIEAAENMLESAEAQVDFLHSRLVQLKERIENTEALINLELDHRRNELVALDLVMTIGATALGAVAAVGGIFGMNLHPLPIESTQIGFWSATLGSIGIAVLLFIGTLFYARTKKILLIPSSQA